MLVVATGYESQMVLENFEGICGICGIDASDHSLRSSEDIFSIGMTQVWSTQI